MMMWIGWESTNVLTLPGDGSTSRGDGAWDREETGVHMDPHYIKGM